MKYEKNNAEIISFNRIAPTFEELDDEALLNVEGGSWQICVLNVGSGGGCLVDVVLSE